MALSSETPGPNFTKASLRIIDKLFKTGFALAA
jgi:hypothetical protein